MTRVSISVSESSFPSSAVQVTVAVPESSVTTAAPELVAVFATQVAAAVMSQSDPSITRYSSSSATFVIVTVISSKVLPVAAQIMAINSPHQWSDSPAKRLQQVRQTSGKNHG